MTPLGRMTTTARKPNITSKRSFLDRWLNDPEAYPEEFKSWLITYVSQHPNFSVERSALPSLIPYSSLDPHVGTSPPSSPTNGDLWVYQGSGFFWAFMYDSSEATYKWKFVGGPPFSHIIATGQNPASAAYVDLGTVGPSFTIPRSGDYLFEFGAGAYSTVAPATLYMAIKKGAAATADADGARWEPPTANLVGTIATRKLFTGCTSGELYKAQYKDSQTNGVFEYRHLAVTPIRVI